MPTRNAQATWTGNLKEGNGTIKVGSGAFEGKYSFGTRFEGAPGTNPEELIAAAHAGCFTMKLSFVLGAAGFTPDSLETTCVITLEDGTITSSALTVKGQVQGITPEKFQECAADAKANCPVSKAYNMEITLDASLA